MALSRQHRLRHPKSFAAVYQNGAKSVSRHLVLRVLANPSSATGTTAKTGTTAAPDAATGNVPPTRFGISISQKVSKRAVVRNRIKRQIRAVIRQLLPDIKAGFDVVVVVRPSALVCQYEDFLRELKHLLSKLEVLNGHS